MSVRCPHTSETLFVKESQTKSGWTWLFRGREYANLDDILEARGKKARDEVGGDHV